MKSTIRENFLNVFYNHKNKYVKNLNTSNFTIFKSKKIINLSHAIKIYGINFKSGSFSITEIHNTDNNEIEYLLNFRMLNYDIMNNKYKSNIKINNNAIFVSLNKMLKIDKNFKITNENKIIIPPLLKDISNGINLYNKNIIGIEDMRIFNYNNTIKVIGTAQSPNKKTTIVSGNYDYLTNTLSDVNFIENTFNKQEVEKNWVYFINESGELNIIYKWFPLQICSINNNKKLILLKNINMPAYFKNARGSTCGVKYNNQNWFIAHLNEEGNYYHFFVIFDTKMNLIRYSNKFKFEGCRIEFCIGFTINENNIIICYSLNDTISKLAIYDKERLKKLTWF